MESIQPLISVIIPTYQAENSIEKCLDTVIGQTYKNLEILVSDDGSNDHTREIIDNYIKRDSRIKAKFNRENRGQSVVRNEMISMAKGQFYCFVDSDDYVDETLIDNLYESITTNNTDIAICNYFTVSIDGEVQAVDQHYRGIMNKDKFCEEILADRCPSFLWNKMFKPSLFVGNLLCEGIVWEDLEWFARTCVLLGGASFVEKPLYYYVENVSSTVHKKERMVYKSGCIAYAFCQRYKVAVQTENLYLKDIALGEMIGRILSYQVYKKYYNDSFSVKYDAEIDKIFKGISAINVLMSKKMGFYKKAQYICYRANENLFMILSKYRLRI